MIYGDCNFFVVRQLVGSQKFYPFSSLSVTGIINIILEELLQHEVFKWGHQCQFHTNPLFLLAPSLPVSLEQL